MPPAVWPVLRWVITAAVAATPPEPTRTVSGGPYCGVSCVYAAARMCGRPVELETLLDQRYIGSDRGSTIGELQRAAADLGMHSAPMSGLTPAALRNSPHPVILHVRRPGHQTPYAHWVLFAGVQDDRARIVDPPAGVELVPFSELAALWDGVGLVVSDGPPDADTFRYAAWAESAAVLAVVGLGLVVVRAGTRGRSHRTVAPACAILLTGATVGLAWQVLDPGGLYADRPAAALVAGQHFRPAIPDLGLDETRSLVGRPGVIVVDARTPADYAAGHLPGAVSLPVFAGLGERRAVAEGVPDGARVIVYCQSRGCVWADSVAADLYHRGRRNVAVFRGGWSEWSRYDP